MFDHAFSNVSHKKVRWHTHSLLRITLGIYSLVGAFLAIMQETTVRGVLLSFATLQSITNLDGVAYSLSGRGFLGKRAQKSAWGIGNARYNYDAYSLPSGTKFCCDCGGKSTVEKLDGKLRLCTMLVFVIIVWSFTTAIVVQQAGDFRCSQKIINDELYKRASETCSQSGEVPFVMGILRSDIPNIEWNIVDLGTGNNLLTNATRLFQEDNLLVNKRVDEYLFYTCLPSDVTAVWTIERAKYANEDSDKEKELKFFKSDSPCIYKIRSGVAIDGIQTVIEDGKEKDAEVCSDKATYSKKTGKIQAIHLVGNQFSQECPASSITDRLDCLGVENVNNSLEGIGNEVLML